MTRVFIFPFNEKDHMKPTIKFQINGGINVRVRDITFIPTELQRDFAIYDNKYVLLLLLTTDNQTVVESIIMDKIHVRFYERIYERILRESKDPKEIYDDL